MSDISLRQDILDELEFEPAVNAAHIGVAVDKNVVTVTGMVSSYAEKTAALSAVRRVRSVRAVADEIQVHYPFEKKTSDSEIAKRALDILGWDAMIPSGSIDVVVRDGWLTLEGDVDWYYQKQAAEDDVRKLSGVRGVTNSIVIKPHVKAADVKKKIEEALKRHAEVEASAIRVTVRDNDKVTLEGTVNHWDERYAVENAAWSAPGVKSVDDRLAIA